MTHEHRAGRTLVAAIDPFGLVREYVKRDAMGERLRPSPWFQQVVTWPAEPGYDSYTVIRGYNVERPASIAGSPAKILVRYDVIGWVVWRESQLIFLDQPKDELHEFVVVRDDAGWRIDAPQMGQRVLAEVAAASEGLTQEDAARIRELAAQATTEP